LATTGDFPILQLERFAGVIGGRVGIGGAVTLCVGVYLLFMLIYPCVPVQTPSGEAVPISRGEYLILYASAPSVYFWQWTGGTHEIEFLDRLPVLAIAGAWLLPAWMVGMLAIQNLGGNSHLRFFERTNLSFLVGTVLLQEIALVYGTLVEVHSLPILWCITGIAAAGIFLAYRKSHLSNRSTKILGTSDDASFGNAWFRRLYGLMFLTTLWLGCYQLAANFVSSIDLEVRFTDGWTVKHAIQENRLRVQPLNLEANRPSGFALTDLVCATISNWIQSPSQLTHDDSEDDNSAMSHRRLASIAGKWIRGWVGLSGMLFVSLVTSRLWGALPGLFLLFLFVSTPGIVELTRLGRIESLWGVYGCTVIAILVSNAEKPVPFSSSYLAAIVGAGALMLGNGGAILIAFPVFCLTAWNSLANASVLRKHVGEGSIFSRIPLLRIGCLLFILGVPVFWHLQSQFAGYAVESPRRSFQLTESSQLADIPESFLSHAILRLLCTSSVHHLVLLPVALIGVAVIMQSPALRRTRSLPVLVYWMIAWSFVWLFGSTSFDREWIGVLVLAVLPAALGLRWLMNRAHPMGTFSIVFGSLVWSALIVPVWPLCDNRWLMAYREEVSELAVVSQVIQSRTSRGAGSHTGNHLMILGSTDDGEFACRTTSFSARQTIVPDSSEAIDRSITHLLIDWDGLRRIDQDLGSKHEQAMRRSWKQLNENREFREIEDDRIPSRYSLFERIVAND
jgi:hypothetical protein